MRAIDAEDLKRSIAVSALIEDQKTLGQIIDDMPTIEERKKGKWKEEMDTGERMLACSACGGRVFLETYETAVGEHGYRFCPYCGSRMER